MSQLTDQLMKQLRFIAEASNAFLHQKKQKLSGQDRVLAILKEEDGLVQSYLAEVLDLRPSSLAELLKKMELNDLITRTADENDKRIKRVYLTENGKKRAAELTASKEKDASETFFAGLNEAEQKEFSAFLEKISAGWDADFKQKADRFVDPLDRLRMMQGFRDEMMNEFGADWRDMSSEDKKALRKEFKNKMKDCGFDFSQGFGGFGGPFARGFHHGPHSFGPGPFGGKPRDPHTPDDEDEWKDF